LLSYHINQVI